MTGNQFIASLMAVGLVVIEVAMIRDRGWAHTAVVNAVSLLAAIAVVGFGHWLDRRKQ